MMPSAYIFEEELKFCYDSRPKPALSLNSESTGTESMYGT